jgi:hypothetical protein
MVILRCCVVFVLVAACFAEALSSADTVPTEEPTAEGSCSGESGCADVGLAVTSGNAMLQQQSQVARGNIVDHADDAHHFKTSRAMRHAGSCSWIDIGKKSHASRAEFKPCAKSNNDCTEHKVENEYGGYAGWSSVASAQDNCGEWDECAGFWQQTNGWCWAMDEDDLAAAVRSADASNSAGAWLKKHCTQAPTSAAEGAAKAPAKDTGSSAKDIVGYRTGNDPNFPLRKRDYRLWLEKQGLTEEQVGHLVDQAFGPGTSAAEGYSSANDPNFPLRKRELLQWLEKQGLTEKQIEYLVVQAFGSRTGDALGPQFQSAA